MIALSCTRLNSEILKMYVVTSMVSGWATSHKLQTEIRKSRDKHLLPNYSRRTPLSWRTYTIASCSMWSVLFAMLQYYGYAQQSDTWDDEHVTNVSMFWLRHLKAPSSSPLNIVKSLLIQQTYSYPLCISSRLWTNYKRLNTLQSTYNALPADRNIKCQSGCCTTDWTDFKGDCELWGEQGISASIMR